MSTVHIRNGRAERRPHVHAEGVTWCGKKLLGSAVIADGIETFVSYGSEVRATVDPSIADCPHCSTAFDAAYNAAFPDGLKPIATIKSDDPRARELLGPDALRRHFGPGGGGMPAFEQSLRDAGVSGDSA